VRNEAPGAGTRPPALLLRARRQLRADVTPAKPGPIDGHPPRMMPSTACDRHRESSSRTRGRGDDRARTWSLLRSRPGCPGATAGRSARAGGGTGPLRPRRPGGTRRRVVPDGERRRVRQRWGRRRAGPVRPGRPVPHCGRRGVEPPVHGVRRRDRLCHCGRALRGVVRLRRTSAGGLSADPGRGGGAMVAGGARGLLAKPRGWAVDARRQARRRSGSTPPAAVSRACAFPGATCCGPGANTG
jgi:hypothetical protein